MQQNRSELRQLIVRAVNETACLFPRSNGRGLSFALFSRRHRLEQESRYLAAQRDALLPRLVSGEIKVGEVS